MRLVINPHDDVSLRRVINVAGARGSAKAVMEAVDGHSRVDDAPAAGTDFTAARGGPGTGGDGQFRCWSRLVRGTAEASAFRESRDGVADRVS